MLAFSTERTIKNIFVVSAHKISNESINLFYYDYLNLIKFQINLSQYVVYYILFSTTSSIRPNDLATSAVIKLSLSRALLISSTDLFVCFE